MATAAPSASMPDVSPAEGQPEVQSVPAVNDDPCGTGLSLEERLAICMSVGEECIQEAELRTLLAKKPNPIAYDGFEPSGRMHIAQGVQKCINVNKLTKCGVNFKFWVADWFAQLNNKMGGDLKKIQTVGKYFVEIWRAVGMDMSRVEFLYASEEINKRPDEYWSLVMDVARKNSVTRIKRCCTIMGRQEEDDSVPSSMIFYPCMQCADVFYLKADICQLGMDQRKVNMLAREYCDTIRPKRFKPIILSHKMMPGLLEGQEKMSKSDPNSAIFMEDGEHDVNTKIKKAYCPPLVVEGNPCIEYLKLVIFPWFGSFEVTRKQDNGAITKYESLEQLQADYIAGTLHPGDLKPSLAAAINRILQPVRDHFVNDKDAAQLLKQVKSYKVTR